MVEEKWLHRADLAESAINERHSQRLWGLMHTNLAVAAWPPHVKEKTFYRWHYWWQAHYLDCLVDAAKRRPTKDRKRRIQTTIRGIKLRNFGSFKRNNYYDDKLWLALALDRAASLNNKKRPKYIKALEHNILEGLDPVASVLPWRVGETFFNTPTNGPAAIMLARQQNLGQARFIVDWIFDKLINEDGLVMDGLRMTMNGPELVKAIHPYCQGVAVGACLDIALSLMKHPGTEEEAINYIVHIRALIKAIDRHMTNAYGVIDWNTGDGDGGLFKGILARYLADVAVRLPGDSEANIAAKKRAKRIVLASAESLWQHRLEVDGLPIFGTDWLADAKLPHNYGGSSGALSDLVHIVRVDERDLSVQLSGWMLMEAAARIARHDMAQLANAERRSR
ncbi:glycoside hydrolase family 76 [Corynebacterium sp. ES2730-CONJ]|uniref:glycoside hydrolase family 76 protein n=1 Tax=Corynebacterium sp. ES2730-CONJ TaxID=2973941 RepID=UPI00216AFF46|nr:glycoside hydrolase family 76 protein [Corynebacterium sp. ES2730-CONJ]MCS4532101.1 glycoside hydrolase family 76 [Corynebacterium sp. ES2730-CONJ]